MKKMFFLAVLAGCMTTAFAQSEKYMSAMKGRLEAMDTTRSADGMKSVSAAFERIAEAEKTQWLPFYYAALSQVNAGFTFSGGRMGGMTTELDAFADKAEALINRADALSKDNSEIYVVKKMIATLRMMADPMTRYMQYGPIGAEALATAKKLDVNNPRVYLMEALDKFNTPEQFGGSKTEAKKLFEEAMAKYNMAKYASDLDPRWGKEMTQQYLKQMQ